MPSYGEIFSYGWKKTKENFLFLLGVVLIIFGIPTVGNILQEFLRPELGVFVSVLGIAFYLVNVVLEIGYLRIALNIVEGKTSEYNDLYKRYPLFLKFFLTSILVGVSVIVGIILLIIPGIFVAVKLQFSPLLVVDQKLGPIDAVKKSWEITKGNWLRIFFFDILLILLNILGAIALLVGLLVTIPLSTIAYAYLYKKLNK